MRALLACLVALSACTAATEDGGDPSPPASVRERIATETRMLVAPADSTGTIGAAHWADGAWQTGQVALAVDNGEVVAVANAAGGVKVTRFALAFATIDLPPTLLGHAAQLTNVRVTLHAPAAAAATWTDDDHVSLAGAFDLDLAWNLTVDGTALPIGAPTLTGIPLELELSGDGARVAGDLHVHATGELWSWAGLVKLQDLDLAVGAATTY